MGRNDIIFSFLFYIIRFFYIFDAWNEEKLVNRYGSGLVNEKNVEKEALFSYWSSYLKAFLRSDGTSEYTSR